MYRYMVASFHETNIKMLTGVLTLGNREGFPEKGQTGNKGTCTELVGDVVGPICSTTGLKGSWEKLKCCQNWLGQYKFQKNLTVKIRIREEQILFKHLAEF